MTSTLLKVDGAMKYDRLLPRQIRLLSVASSATETSTIRCEVLVCDIDSISGCYMAISYTWGDSTPTHQLLIENATIAITKNVHDIISHLQSNKPGTLFWIDALCINQQDLAEKSHQVPLMGEIYSHAASVTVWLGEASEDSSLAFDFLEILEPVLRTFKKRDKSERSGVFNAHDELDRLTSSRQGSPQWIALQHLLQRPWFERAWIIQEVALAKKAQVVCGDRKVDWEVFGLVMLHLTRLGLMERLVSLEESQEIKAMILPASVVVVRNIALVKIDIQHGELSPIEQSLRFFSTCKATDPRDKIYSMLGITSDTTEPEFVPDYTKTAQQLYTDAARCLIRRDQTVVILQDAGIGWRRSIEGLPSWVADWSTNPSNPRMHHNLSKNVPCQFSFSPDGLKLCSRGRIVDSIDRLGSIHGVETIKGFEKAAISPDSISNTYEWILEAQKIYQSTKPQPKLSLFSRLNKAVWQHKNTQPSHEIDDKFWRTLITNNISNNLWPPNQAVPHSSYTSYFSSFMALYHGISTSPLPLAQQRYPQELIDQGKAFRGRVLHSTTNRRFCTTPGMSS
jgi:hypothetical protein